MFPFLIFGVRDEEVKVLFSHEKSNKKIEKSQKKVHNFVLQQYTFLVCFFHHVMIRWIGESGSPQVANHWPRKLVIHV